jgi:hypothetical protein
MLELGERYFSPGNTDGSEDEYKELAYEDALDGWRHI